MSVNNAMMAPAALRARRTANIASNSGSTRTTLINKISQTRLHSASPQLAGIEGPSWESLDGDDLATARPTGVGDHHVFWEVSECQEKNPVASTLLVS